MIRFPFASRTRSAGSTVINDFQSVVVASNRAAIVSFCDTALGRISPTRFEMRQKNWRADREVLIVGMPAEE